ncbi:uncharacterized protein LOC101859490 [Aplysia californica]|uniref:Uncharacterized protein LOC101859490 n=1 Tax=Aplysia californica TaxID=6500 RepID=A0ABM1A1Z7_APLCA|nr:uncharacterized protein LOC101859490 [Aplysia californica]
MDKQKCSCACSELSRALVKVLLEGKDEPTAHAYNAHIQEIDDQTQSVVAFIEELGVKQSVPADRVRPLPLQIPKLVAGENPLLPVADLDLLPYVKKNRRRKGVSGSVVGRSLLATNHCDRTSHIPHGVSGPAAHTVVYNSNNNHHFHNIINSSSSNTNCNDSSGCSDGNRLNNSTSSDSSTSSNNNSSSGGGPCHPHHHQHAQLPHNRRVISGSPSFIPALGIVGVALDGAPHSGVVFANGDCNGSIINNNNSGNNSGTTTTHHVSDNNNNVTTFVRTSGGGGGVSDSNQHVSYGGPPQHNGRAVAAYTLTGAYPGPDTDKVQHHSLAGYNGLDYTSAEVTTARFDSAHIACVNPPVAEPGVLAPPLEPGAVPPTYCMMSAGGQGGATYWMPMVAVPYAGNMGQVNLGWGPSHDLYGKDLPLSGVEYYRMSACGQPGAYQPGLMYPAPAAGGEMTPTGPVLMDTTGAGYSGVLGCPPDVHATREFTSAAGGRVGGGGGGERTPREAAARVVVVGSEASSVGGEGSFVDEDCEGKSNNNNNASSTAQPGESNASHANRFVNHNKSHKTYSASNNNDESGDTVNGGCGNHSENSNDNTNVSGSGPKTEASTDSRRKPTSGNGVSENGGDVEEEEEVGDSMEVGSDGDSGCPSECTDLSPLSAPDTAFTSGELAPESSAGVETSPGAGSGGGDSVKPAPRGKRRYYMYGNHKLVKPIKEIPLRFQMLLAETSAAKARCEGQPIYMQQPPQHAPQQAVYDMVYYPAPAAAAATAATDGSQQAVGLNANASCFIPGQAGESAYLPPECYAMCPVSGYSPSPAVSSNPAAVPNNLPSNPASHSSLQPAPLFVPPAPPMHPGSTPPSSQVCQTFIVYSSPSSSSTAISQSSNSATAQQVRSIAMPPPPFPPPATQPPPVVDHLPTKSAPSLSPAVNQVVMSVSGNLSQSKPTETAIKSASSTGKAPTVLTIPPPNHMQAPPPHLNSTLAHIPPSSLPPPQNPNVHINNTTVLTVPQVVNHIAAAPPNSASVSHAPPPTIHVSSTSSPNTYCPNAPHAYDANSTGQQYMYIYPSPPTGHSSPPSQVMYMVSPSYPSTQAYQQTGVLVPPNCPVPVQ